MTKKGHPRRIKRIKRLIWKLYGDEIDEIHDYTHDIIEGYL